MPGELSLEFKQLLNSVLQYAYFYIKKNPSIKVKYA